MLKRCLFRLPTERAGSWYAVMRLYQLIQNHLTDYYETQVSMVGGSLRRLDGFLKFDYMVSAATPSDVELWNFQEFTIPEFVVYPHHPEITFRWYETPEDVDTERLLSSQAAIWRVLIRTKRRQIVSDPLTVKQVVAEFIAFRELLDPAFGLRRWRLTWMLLMREWRFVVEHYAKKYPVDETGLLRA